jgi:hypothetical protein
MSKNTGAAILGRLIEPEHANLSPETARFILRMDFRKKDHLRMAKLQAKASRGTLTPKDKEELNEYLRVADWLALFQSKARNSFKGAVVSDLQ